MSEKYIKWLLEEWANSGKSKEISFADWLKE
jgi:hypothetical protein